MINLANIKTAAATVTLVFTDKTHREQWFNFIRLFNNRLLKNEYEKNANADSLTYIVGNIEAEIKPQLSTKAVSQARALSELTTIILRLTTNQAEFCITHKNNSIRIYGVKDADLIKKCCPNFTIKIERDVRHAELVINYE